MPLAITVPHQAVAAAAAREHIAGMRLRFVQQAHLVGMVLFPALPSACQLAILVGSAVAQYQGIGRGPVTASVLLMGALLAASEGVARVCYPAGAAPAMPADAPHALNVGPHALYLLSLVLHVMAESVIAAHAGADLRAARRAYPDLDVPRPDVRPPHAPGPGAFVPDVAAPDVPALAAEPGA